MNNDDNLELLDLNDDDAETMDALPDATPFAAPRPKKPWLLLGVGVLVIVLATYIIIRVIGGDSSSSIEVDLDAPAVIVDGESTVPIDLKPAPMPVNVETTGKAQKLVVPEKQPAKRPVEPAVVQAPKTPQYAPQPVQQPAPVPKQVQQEKVGTPVRVVEDRKEVTFNPDKPVAQKPAAKTATQKPVVKQQVAPKGSWYVQFGSYSTRALAESAQRKIQSEHQNLFSGKQFVILAAVLPNGTTTYRLRIAFSTSAEANGFCKNAKSDGLDCYVAK